MTPGPGKVFVRPAERLKIRESGIALPKTVQDDADHGEVIAVGEGAWYGVHPHRAGLEPEPVAAEVPEGWERVRRVMPVAVGDVVFYDCQNVEVLPLGFSAASDVVHVLEVRNILGTVVHG